MLSLIAAYAQADDGQLRPHDRRAGPHARGATRGLAIPDVLLMRMLGGACAQLHLPAWLQAVSAWAPTHWAVEGLDAGRPGAACPSLPSLPPTAVMLAFAAFTAVALWRFRWEEEPGRPAYARRFRHRPLRHDSIASASASTPALSLSDSRTNAGLAITSTFRKMMIYEKPGDRFMVMFSAGNLSISQSVRDPAGGEAGQRRGEPITIWNAPACSTPPACSAARCAAYEQDGPRCGRGHRVSTPA